MGEGRYLCADCFMTLGQKMFASSEATVSGDKKKLLRKWAKEHSAEIVDRDVLREIVETGCRKMFLQKMDPEVAYGHMVNRLAFATGMAAERRTLQVLEALHGTLDNGIADLVKEVRENMRKLHDLGTE